MDVCNDIPCLKELFDLRLTSKLMFANYCLKNIDPDWEGGD